MAIDPVSGKVFVADAGNNRVLRFASTDALFNGIAAEAVLGQPDFTTITTGTSQNKMSGPFGVFVDPAGRLWVADSDNNRILRFDDAANKNSGASANGVLGQTDFTSGSAGAGQNMVTTPEGVAGDSNGRLYVSDTGNNRVIWFDNAANKTNGDNADGVLGQPDFVTNNQTIGQASMLNPDGVFVDAAGRLWVTDTGNNRVLRFDDAINKTNGSNADGVLGQTDFTTGTPGAGKNKLTSPEGVGGEATGRIYVSDSSNSRVLWFDSAASKTNGGDANGVLGQPDFSTTTAGLSATNLGYPTLIYYDALLDRLWVADATNNRVLQYGSVIAPEIAVLGNGVVIPDGETTPSVTNNTDFGGLSLGYTITHTFTISNSGTANLNLTRVPIISITATGASSFAVNVEPATPVLSNTTTSFVLSFNPSLTGLHSATVSIANNTNDHNPYTFAIQGVGTNLPPIANAGSNQTVPGGASVTLDGSGSYDPDGNLPLTYHWTQTAGISVTLSSSSAVSPTFTAPNSITVLHFSLVVTDSYGLASLTPSVVSINVIVPGYGSLPAPNSTINLGEALVGSPITTTLTISDTGNADLTVSSLTFSGTNAADFSITPNNVTIPAGSAAQDLIIRCTPGAPGLRTATLTAIHNASGSPAIYTVNCTGRVKLYMPILFK